MTFDVERAIIKRQQAQIADIRQLVIDAYNEAILTPRPWMESDTYKELKALEKKAR